MWWRWPALLLAGTLLLAGCGQGSVHSQPDATPEEASRMAYVHDGPPALTLYTMISNRSGAGAHTSLMVNASQRVIFDPAGSVRMSIMPEIGDVLYGITPQVEAFYERAHARETYHVRIQRIEVPPDVAETALRLVQARGRVSPTACTIATANILAELPGFEQLRGTLFPGALARQFAELPGVEDRRLYEDDADDKQIAVEQFEATVEDAGR